MKRMTAPDPAFIRMRSFAHSNHSSPESSSDTLRRRDAAKAVARACAEPRALPGSLPGLCFPDLRTVASSGSLVLFPDLPDFPDFPEIRFPWDSASKMAIQCTHMGQNLLEYNLSHPRTIDLGPTTDLDSRALEIHPTHEPEGRRTNKNKSQRTAQ
jgi:hypothetical protein